VSLRRAAELFCLLGAISALAAATPALASATPAPSLLTFTNLSLVNGWHTYGGSAKPAATNISGIITFRGAMSTGGTNPIAFTLPTGFRPATNVYVSVDLCNANKGELFIKPTGVVKVQAEGGNFSQAQCFTSLDGVSFATTATSFTALTLQNGWKNSANGTSKAAVRVINGIVHLKGAISGGTSATVFTLPPGFRPSSGTLYVPVDLCHADNGHLRITPTGTVVVEAEQAPSDTTCFTSLDGATFAISASGFSPLTLQNGWATAGEGGRTPAAQLAGGIVRFEGAMVTAGSNAFPFVLPPGLRPATTVYVQVGLFFANKGRLEIEPNGTVIVQAEGNTFVNAANLTSLEGAWFVL
jgi:hypothetical protein